MKLIWSKIIIHHVDCKIRVYHYFLLRHRPGTHLFDHTISIGVVFAWLLLTFFFVIADRSKSFFLEKHVWPDLFFGQILIYDCRRYSITPMRVMQVYMLLMKGGCLKRTRTNSLVLVVQYLPAFTVSGVWWKNEYGMLAVELEWETLSVRAGHGARIIFWPRPNTYRFLDFCTSDYVSGFRWRMPFRQVLLVCPITQRGGQKVPSTLNSFKISAEKSKVKVQIFWINVFVLQLFISCTYMYYY